MRVTVFGTGMVGRGHALRLRELGHDVTIAARRRHSGSDYAWLDGFDVVPFTAAVADAELVINGLNGSAAVEVFERIAAPLAGTVVVDISNPLDFASGDLELFVCNTDSLGEQVQRAVPDARVVKTLCTVHVDLQVDPSTLADGQHTMFLAGNDADAKEQTTALLREYGWRDVVDLGDLRGARALEMMLPLWLALYRATGDARLNYRLVRP